MTWQPRPALGLPRFRPCFKHANVRKTAAAAFQNHASVKHGRWHRRCTSCSHPHSWQRAIDLSLRVHSHMYAVLHSGSRSTCRQLACCAAAASKSRAVWHESGGRRDKRTRHQAARKASLHMVLARHAPDNGTVPSNGARSHESWRDRVPATL